MIEILIVMAILSILASIVVASVWSSRERAYLARAKEELRNIANAIDLFRLDNDLEYPPDANRDLPIGIETYLSTKTDWPRAPWPGSVYDWDYWDSNSANPDAGDISSPPSGVVHQISIRFCITGDPPVCNYPMQDWADDFGYFSSAYFCIDGPCRAHGSQSIDYPGCCMGGNCPVGAQLCQ